MEERIHSKGDIDLHPNIPKFRPTAMIAYSIVGVTELKLAIRG
jgi:hypothetical protein